MASIRLDGHFGELNPAFSELVGYAEQEFQAASWPPVADRANLAKHREQIQRMLAGEIESARVDTGYVHAQGLLVPVVGQISLVRESGQPSHFLLEVESRLASARRIGCAAVPVRPPQLLSLLDRAREEVPGGVEIFDAHTHLGANDPDGFHCTGPELVDLLGRAGARGVVFPMHEPDGYTAANDMVIAEAEASDGRAGARSAGSTPPTTPLAEAERCLAAGARGIKLHPRAEGFALDHPALQDVFALADERRLPVLVHAGRGHTRARAGTRSRPCGRYPGMRLILAHAGISDLSWIWREAPVPPEPVLRHRVVVAQRPPGAARARAARARSCSRATRPTAPRRCPPPGRCGTRCRSGSSPEQMRSVMGGQIARLLAGEEPADLGPPPGPEAGHDRRAARPRAHLPGGLPRPGLRRARSRRRRWRSPSSPATWATTRRRRRSAAGSWR